MIYHQGNSRNALVKKKIITLILLFGISIFILIFAPIRNTLTQFVYTVAPSIWNIGDGVLDTLDSLLTNFRSKDALLKENRALLAEMERTQAQILDRNLLSEKVIKLEEALGRVAGDNRVVANVLVGAAHSPYDILVVDAGKKEGVGVGDMVVYAGSGVVGEIVEVSAQSSKLKLYSSSGVEEAVVVGAKRVPAKAVGRGMGNFEAKIPQDSEVFLGDNVVSAKSDLILGTISHIEEKPAEPFRRIFFRSPFNINEMQSVEIIIEERS
ncbi:MAG: rod shape-determining protein MreC [bacterium]|nr:rod shape-determining protein MreC [bacterium]